MSHQKARNSIPCSFANIETAVRRDNTENLTDTPRKERGHQVNRNSEDTRNSEVYRRSALDHF